MKVIYSDETHDSGLEALLVRAHWWPLIIRGHGSHLGDGDVGLEALDFHIIRFDGQVCLAMGDVERAGGRALCLGQLVLLLACLALCGCKFKTVGHQSLGNRVTFNVERLKTIRTRLILYSFGYKTDSFDSITRITAFPSSDLLQTY